MPNLEWAFNPKFMWFEPGAFSALYHRAGPSSAAAVNTICLNFFFPLFYFVIWQVDWISCFSLSPCRCNHVLSAPKAYQPSGRQRCWASQEQGDGGRGGPSGHGLCCQHPAAGKTKLRLQPVCEGKHKAVMKFNYKMTSCFHHLI